LTGGTQGASPVGTLPFGIVYTYCSTHHTQLRCHLHGLTVRFHTLAMFTHGVLATHFCSAYTHSRRSTHTYFQNLPHAPALFTQFSNTVYIFAPPSHSLVHNHALFRERESRDTETHRNYPNVNTKPEHVPRGLGLRVFAQPIIW